MQEQGLTRVVSSVILMMGLGAWAFPQVPSKRRELVRIQKELEATHREIEEYKRIEEALRKDMQRLENHDTQARRKIIELEGRRRLAEERKADLRKRLGALGQASNFWFSAMSLEARRHAALAACRNDAFGTRDLWAESFRRSAIFEKAWLLGGIQGLGHKTALAEAETRRKAQELKDKSLKVAFEQKTRRQEYQQKKAVMAQTQEKAAQAVARAKELEESARALTKLIKSLSQGKRYQRPSALAKLDVPRHSLPWPAEGFVVRPFGRERNTELNTWVIHQGIVLETKPAAAVVAIENGSVIFSGFFRSYGQVLIIDHGLNFYSIYGGLGEILKSKGSEVRLGELVARAGRSKLGGGGSLYLELRRGVQALDPMVWFKRK